MDRLKSSLRTVLYSIWFIGKVHQNHLKNAKL